MRDNETPTRLRRLKSVLTALTYISSILSLLGISALSILAGIARRITITDAWEAMAILFLSLLIPSTVLAVRGVVSAKVAKREGPRKLYGRAHVAAKERQLISGATESIAYIVGDFSQVWEIGEALSAVYNHGVRVRVLASDSQAPQVVANLNQAVSLHCVVRRYGRDVVHPVKALIVDAGEAEIEGEVLFVKKTPLQSIQAWGTGLPGNDTTHNYEGTIYSDRLLVNAVQQMFDGWWEKSAPFIHS